MKKDKQATEKTFVKNRLSEKRRFERRNLFVLIICIVFAFVLWIYVMQTDSPEYERSLTGITVTLENENVLSAERGMTVFGSGGYTVDITIKGQKSIIDKVSPEDITARANVAALTDAGRHTVDVDVSLPSGVVLASARPSIGVYVDTPGKTMLEVRAEMLYSISGLDYEIEQKPAVDYVEVSGPQTILDSLSYARVSRELGSISGSLKITEGIAIVNKSGETVESRYISASPSSVEVSVQLTTTAEVELYAGYKYGYYNDSNVRVSIEPATVTLRGDPQVLSEYGGRLACTTIDETKNETIINEVLSLPDGVTVEGGGKNVTIRVTNIGTTTRGNFMVTQIRAVNVPDGLKYTFKTEELEATLRGTWADLSDVDEKLLIAEIDLSSCTLDMEGETIREARIVSPSGVYAVGEYTVSVALGS